MCSQAEPFAISDIDVIIADDEDICRAAAASSLVRFGFLPEHVHECENGDEALDQVVELQNSNARVVSFAGQERCLPVIVFLDIRMPGSDGLGCARQVCSLYGQRYLPREPFLVRASSKRLSTTNADEGKFHCSVPKTFATQKLRYCFDLCQHWWIQGGGEPGRVPLAMEVSYSEAVRDDLANESATPAKASDAIAWPAPATVAATVAVDAPAAPAAAARPAGPAAAAGYAAGGKEQAALPPRTAGNSIESLDNLAPPRPPFEDVEMICLVGRGSFGRVFQARWDISTVALKVVEHMETEKPSIMAFEGKLSSSLAHPNLVQTFKYSVRDGGDPSEDTTNRLSSSKAGPTGFELWIVQEWCGLGTLGAKISSREILEHGGFPEVIEVATEICSAARYLHCRGIIHGDLTGSNVLLVERTCPKGYVCKVSDFGLARVLDTGASSIKTASMGTVTYMPPELFQLEGCALTKKVDVYAFGVILWQLCTSQRPFDGLQPTQVVVMVAQGATLELPATVPTLLAQVFRNSVARTPAERPSFDELVQELLPMASHAET